VLINEIATKSNTTKKSVQYYVAEGLIVPKILENGYQDFSEEDMQLLKQIVLYRKLGLSIAEIKSVLKNPNELISAIHQRTLELEREKIKQELLRRIAAGEKLENLEREINTIDAGSIIIKKLLELFPGYYGKFLSLNFASYLTGEIETEEQMKAFQQIIDFFDSVPDMDLPEDLQQFLDEHSEMYTTEEGVEILNDVLQKKQDAIQNIEAFIADNKETIDKYKIMRQTEEFMQSPAFRLMEYMKKFCTNSGYYEVFIPAMRRLSSSYNAYYEQMLIANEKFVEIYPDYISC
jgi:DNA-binding transcriptional MerR regulator